MKSKQNLTQNPEINSLARQNELDACLDARHVEPGLRARGWQRRDARRVSRLADGLGQRSA